MPEFRYEPPKYSPSEGIKAEWESAPRLWVDVDGDVVVRGNRDGLISLAKHLLTLAQDGAPVGSHIHYEPGDSLEDGSAPLTFEVTAGDARTTTPEQPMSPESDVALMRELLAYAPGFGREYGEHLEEQGELLSHVLMGDFTRHFIDAFRRAAAADAQGRREGPSVDLDGVLRLFEARWIEGVQETRDLIGASFLENLWQAEELYGPIKEVLASKAPRLFAQLCWMDE